jgi:NAD(P)-dependent dehydrogenase (short-subunit alcohol dehydrogenase family)
MQMSSIGAVVTGGASEPGAATAQMLAGNGAKVTIFDLNPDLTAQTAEARSELVQPAFHDNDIFKWGRCERRWSLR